MTAENQPVLSLSHLPAETKHTRLPEYDLQALRPGVLHIGLGAFHRAHQCTYFERLANLGETACGVFGVSLQSAGVHEALQQQNHLYSLTTLATERSIQVMGCLRGSAGPGDLASALQLFVSDDLKLVTLTVTEKAYQDPGSRMAQFLTEGLRRRMALDLPLVVASCDNLRGNGDRLSQLILECVGEDVPFRRWIETRVHFPNSMVDAITPRASEALLSSALQHLGVKDQVPVQREPYVEWVLEACELPFDLSAVGVEMVRDVAPYEMLKLRILNASHSLLAYLGSLLGHRTVFDAISDERVRGVVRRFMQTMASQLSLPSSIDTNLYIEKTLERFANPGVEHLLLQIAEDGSSKLKERVVPALISPADPQSALLCLPIVCWVEFVRRQLENNVGLVDLMLDESVSLEDMSLEEAEKVIAVLQTGDRQTDSLIVDLARQLRRDGVESFLSTLSIPST